MKIDDKITIFGAGGFGREILCLLVDIFKKNGTNYKDVVTFAESDESWKERIVLGVPVIPLSLFNPAESQAIIGTGDPNIRKKI